jgi:hypothetical protein
VVVMAKVPNAEEARQTQDDALIIMETLALNFDDIHRGINALGFCLSSILAQIAMVNDQGEVNIESILEVIRVNYRGNLRKLRDEQQH